MRFLGQAFEVPVPVPVAALASLAPDGLAESFAEAHRRVYFHGGEKGRRAEVVGLRYAVRHRLDALPEITERGGVAVRSAGTAPVRLAGGRPMEARLLDAAAFTGGAKAEGPALIEGYSSSTWVPPGWHAARDTAGNLLMRRVGA
jgi:N-methylhydantoinase A